HRWWRSCARATGSTRCGSPEPRIGSELRSTVSSDESSPQPLVRPPTINAEPRCITRTADGAMVLRNEFLISVSAVFTCVGRLLEGQPWPCYAQSRSVRRQCMNYADRCGSDSTNPPQATNRRIGLIKAVCGFRAVHT